MSTQMKQDPQQLLATTIRRLQQDADHLSHIDELIGQ